MNTLKRLLGIIWVAAGPVVMFYLIKTAAAEIASKPVIDTKIQWAVFIIVFFPISIGISIFGFYAVKGEYDRLPQSSKDI